MTTLMPIGGNINSKNPVVLREFVRRAGDARARIVVFPQASALEDTGAYYTGLFRDLGVESAVSLEFRTREEAFLPAHLEILQAASGIFIAGGAQMRLTTLLGGSPLETGLKQAFAQGVIVAGTSAGAAVMPRVMMAYGKSGPTPRDRIAQYVPGLGLTQNFAIDQHFRQRDRLGRLLYLVITYPGLIGLGVDEDTAAIVEDDVRVTVCGSGAVTVVDGSGIQASDASDVEDGRVVAASNIRLDVLTHGCSFDCGTRMAVIPRKVSLNE